MKNIFFLMLLYAYPAISQKQEPQYFVYNKDWQLIKNVESARYIVQSTNIGDSVFVNRIFNGIKHLWRQESFSDADQTIPHGAFAWYDDEGRIDSSGYVKNKKRHGNWAYYDDTLGIYLQVKYENSREIERRDYIKKVIKTPEGEKSFDDEKREKDSLKQTAIVSKADEKEAVFEGGAKGYKEYLQKHLEPPTNITKSGVVKLKFIINKSGKIEDLQILKSLQLSADIEALRVLSEMPDWTPAYQNGKNVNYQAIQYITFQVNY